MLNLTQPIKGTNNMIENLHQFKTLRELLKKN
jgi:hypothetical protein